MEKLIPPPTETLEEPPPPYTIGRSGLKPVNSGSKIPPLVPINPKQKK